MHQPTDIDPALIEAAREPLRQRALWSGAIRAGKAVPAGTYCHWGKGKVLYRITGARQNSIGEWSFELTPEPGQRPKNPFWTDLNYITVIDPPEQEQK